MKHKKVLGVELATGILHNKNLLVCQLNNSFYKALHAVEYISQYGHKDWPQNNREAHLTNILNVCEKFINEPSFYHKELLFSLIDTSDMNEINDIGLVRLTSYECAILNQLYYYASITCCFDLKMYLEAF